LSADRTAEIAHQVHGVIGFTYEYSLHRLTRRLWSRRDKFDTESRWLLVIRAQQRAHGGSAEAL
jgi:alkylation response protein AidB-like acyl-CoA dehydrogenase